MNTAKVIEFIDTSRQGGCYLGERLLVGPVSTIIPVNIGWVGDQFG